VDSETGAHGVGLASVTADGTVLDVWFPLPRLGQGRAPGTQYLSEQEAADELGEGVSALLGPDGDREVEVIPVRTGITRLSDPPADAYDVYLRLHLLSTRLVMPNGLSLDGLFGLLTNVVWTNWGPCRVDGFELTRLRLRARGPVTVHLVDKLPRMVDYVVPSGVRIADADRVRLGAHLAAGTTVMHEGFVNFNAGTLGASMIEGRISQGVVVADGSGRRERGNRHLARRRLRRGGRALRHVRHHSHAAGRSGGQGPRPVRAVRAAVPAQLHHRHGRGTVAFRREHRTQRRPARQRLNFRIVDRGGSPTINSVTSSADTTKRSSDTPPVHAVDFGLSEQPLTARPEDPPAVHVRARLDEQLRALIEHDPVARDGTDPEGVHQMRVAVRRIRAALKAEGASLGEPAESLAAELRWLGGVLGPIRDLDVQLDHLRGLAADFEPVERDAVERLLLGLRAARRQARQRMLAALRSERYTALLAALAAAIRSQTSPAGRPPAREQPGVDLIELVKRPYRKLSKAAGALDDDPPDDDLHALRIRGKRLRYAAELAVPVGGKPVLKLIKAAKELQDVLGDHQDAVVAEQEVRRLLAELDDPAATDVGFAAGRLVERERGRRANCRARWRDAMAMVDSHAVRLLAE
jgi:CHAD domain-containing protein